MSLQACGVASLCGTFALLLGGNAADAQWFSAADPCGCAQTAQVQPVVQTCYQTVPVTQYQRVKQTVKRPVVETKYVEQPVTEYRQVTETRTAEVPAVQYQSVTEYRTVQRDAGFWTRQYHCNSKISPCQYDNRPTMLGWLNRTGYAIRQSFVPDYYATNHYVPRVVQQTVPVTRQVAIPSTRKVTYNVTKLVPTTTTRRVAVNTIRYEDQEVVALKPVTVMQTVQVGSRVALAPSPNGGATAYAPFGTAYAPFGAPAMVLQPIPETSTATRPDEKRTASEPDKYERPQDDEETPIRARKTSYPQPPRSAAPSAQRARSVTAEIAAAPAAKEVPSIVRVSGWVARRPTPAAPALTGPEVTLATNGR